MDMQLTVVVENHVARQGMLGEWGYAAWLRAGERNILLDTGGILHVLEHNLRFLKLDAGAVDDIVLSHGHYDHVSGLMDVTRRAPQARIWAARSIARPRRGDSDGRRDAGGGEMLAMARMLPVDPWAEIAPGVIAFTPPPARRQACWQCTRRLWEISEAGELVPDTFSDDVSVLVKTDRGASLLLGCAHAGLPNIMRYAAEAFGAESFYSVIGGTHLSAVPEAEIGAWITELSRYKVKKWRPGHCTGFAAAAALARAGFDVDWAAAGTVHEL
ncbi:MAG: MBL fold metallo-hydrolase [Duodenibacillus sp.]|nr:MBL fold metallo-hydrolase [Duodenibacillus sp.]